MKAGRPLLMLVGPSPAPNERFEFDSVAPVLRWLARDFEVVEPGNLKEDVGPDLVVVLDSGHGFRQLPSVPRVVGAARVWISLADAHSPSRVRWLPQVHAFDPDLFLSFDTTAAELLPSLKGRVGVCPWFVETLPAEGVAGEDEAGIWDAALLGAGFEAIDGARPYRWRAEAREALRSAEERGEFELLLSETGDAAHTYKLHGKAYERALRQSRCALACGSLRQSVVKKHLQIPAVGAVLLAEPSPSLEQLGFVHDENCLLAQPQELETVIRGLRDDPDRRHRLARAGRNLVLSHHGIDSRPHLVNWWRAWRERGAGEFVVQRSLCGEFGLASRSASVEGLLPRSVLGRAVATLYNKLWRGEWHGAAAELELLEDSFPNAIEARFGRMLERWWAGEEEQALAAFEVSVRLYARLNLEGLDPLEWALAECCLGSGSPWAERLGPIFAFSPWSGRGAPGGVTALPVPVANRARWQRFWNRARSRWRGGRARF